MATKIYIDQGHNPQNPNAGAEGNGYREQDLVYTIGQELAGILRAEGYEVRLSRPTPDTQLGTSNATALAARVNDANTWGADYFISLHANASSLAGASGSEAYVYNLNSEAAELAEDILDELEETTGLPDRGGGRIEKGVSGAAIIAAAGAGDGGTTAGDGTHDGR